MPPFGHPVACCCFLSCYVLLRVNCCTKFEAGQTFSHVQKDATTLNIVGPTMLRVVASACTQSNRLTELFRA